MLRIDPASPTPPYEQLRSQLAAQIMAGELATGARLPSVRRLAEDLGLAPNTVARTYRELEIGGLVSSQGRRGTTVTGRTLAAKADPDELTRSYLSAMASLGFDREAVIGRLRGPSA